MSLQCGGKNLLEPRLAQRTCILQLAGIFKQRAFLLCAAVLFVCTIVGSLPYNIKQYQYQKFSALSVIIWFVVCLIIVIT